MGTCSDCLWFRSDPIPMGRHEYCDCGEVMTGEECNEWSLKAQQPHPTAPPSSPGKYNLKVIVEVEEEVTSGYLLFRFPGCEDWLVVDDIKGQWSDLIEEPS